MTCHVRLSLISLVHWLLVTETVTQRYTRNYAGYVFTSPGFSAYRKQDEAQTFCTQNGYQLLEINSSYVQNLTVRFLNDREDQFPNGTLLLTNGIRNDGHWNWVSGSQDINEINISGTEEAPGNSFGFIHFSAAGLPITAGIPTTSRGYICQGKFNCTNGFVLNELCHKSYTSPTVSWFDARNRCLDVGGDLASFDFINDNNKLNSLLNEWKLDTSGSYWIGLRKLWWTWPSSGLEVKYSNWQSGHPVYVMDNRCLCLSKTDSDWKWIECNCSLSFPFLCLADPMTLLTPITTTRVTTTATYITKSSGFKNDIRDIGIGVAIGGAVIIAAIITVVFFVIRKHGCLRKPTASNPPDVTLHPFESHYAEVLKQSESSSLPDASSNQYTPPAVYSGLEVLTGSSFSKEKDSDSLINSKRATLAPPNAHKRTTHFTIDGQEYAEVKEVTV